MMNPILEPLTFPDRPETDDDDQVPAPVANEDEYAENFRLNLPFIMKRLKW